MSWTPTKALIFYYIFANRYYETDEKKKIQTDWKFFGKTENSLAALSFRPSVSGNTSTSFHVNWDFATCKSEDLTPDKSSEERTRYPKNVIISVIWMSNKVARRVVWQFRIFLPRLAEHNTCRNISPVIASFFSIAVNMPYSWQTYQTITKYILHSRHEKSSTFKEPTTQVLCVASFPLENVFSSHSPPYYQTKVSLPYHPL